LSKQNIAIIGGGPASLMLACSLDANKYAISIYEKNAALGRKFLVAGKGGFNLTHSEELSQFAERYYPKEFMEPFLNHFSNTDFRNWLKFIGIETYVGTSKRVFPIKGIKPIEVLNAIETVLKKNNVSVYYNYEWKGWNNEQLTFQTSNYQTSNITADIIVFALVALVGKLLAVRAIGQVILMKKELIRIHFILLIVLIKLIGTQIL